MRIRTNLIIEENLLEKIDAIAGNKNKRAAVIETALREFIEREELKEADDPQPSPPVKKTVFSIRRAGI